VPDAPISAISARRSECVGEKWARNSRRFFSNMTDTNGFDSRASRTESAPQAGRLSEDDGARIKSGRYHDRPSELCPNWGLMSAFVFADERRHFRADPFECAGGNFVESGTARG
jgi:hypothetical protein